MKDLQYEKQKKGFQEAFFGEILLKKKRKEEIYMLKKKTPRVPSLQMCVIDVEKA